MKKIISLILCGVLLTGLSACGSSKNTVESSSETSSVQSKAEHTVDVLSYAGQGTIPELDVSLGTYIDTVKSLYGASSSGDDAEETGEGEDYTMTIYDTYTQVKVDVGDAYFFYKTKYEGKGISRIVCFTNAFDFDIGITMSDDVRDSIDADPALDEDVDKADFLPSTPDNFHRLSYNINDYTLDFYFTDDFLSCIVLTDNRYWVDE